MRESGEYDTVRRYNRRSIRGQGNQGGCASESFLCTQADRGVQNQDVTYSHINNDRTDYSMLQTVKNNKQYFTNNEIKGADLSRKYQEYLFYPGTKLLAKYVAVNIITSSEIIVDNVNRE